MPIVITGWRSRIAEVFRDMLPAGEKAARSDPLSPAFPVTEDRYLFCQGLLRPKQWDDQTAAERAEGMEVNFFSIIRQIARILAHSPAARICVIGSESGYRGSYDEIYAVGKALLHGFVEGTALPQPGQQLVAISPGIIEDAGMTTRREDVERLVRRCDAHPKRRFLKAREVAAMAHLLLYGEGMDYVTGTVVRMHGGEQ